MKIIAEPVKPVTAHRKSVPPSVAAAVMMALEKLPADRFESAKAFADALANPAFVGTAATAVFASGPAVPASRQPAVVLLGVMAALAAGVAAWGWLRPAPAAQVNRYGLAFPASQAPDPTMPVPQPSPDGSFFVYHGPNADSGEGTQLWIKPRDSYEATPISGTANAGNYAVSPDGEWIAFATRDQLMKIPVVGGAAVTLVGDDVASSRGVAWLDDETIVYSTRAPFGLGRVLAGGGSPTRVFAGDQWTPQSPTPIPGGRGVIFAVCSPYCALWVLDLRTDSARVLIDDADVDFGLYVPTGHLVYVQRDGTLLAAAFDLDRLELRGPRVPILERVRVGDDIVDPPFAVSATGTLTMRRGAPAVSRRELVWVDRTGRQTPVDPSWTFQLTTFAGNQGWALSPDGSRLAIGLFTDAGDDIWVKQLPAGPLSRVSYDTAPDFRPRWTRDGRFLTFGSSRQPAGLYERRADGTGTDSLLAAGEISEGLWSPDRRWLLLREGGSLPVAGGRDIVGLRPGIDSAAIPVLATPYDEEAIALSPDGRWLAYQSDESGRTEVFIRPFPDTDGGKWPVSSGGGIAPVWARDGDELYYLGSDDSMMAVSVTGDDTPILGEPQPLFRMTGDLLRFLQFTYYTPWDVGPDGRFIMARLTGSTDVEEPPLIVVENWFEELKARMAR